LISVCLHFTDHKRDRLFFSKFHRVFSWLVSHLFIEYRRQNTIR